VRRIAEQTVGVGWNGKGGTHVGCGNLASKVGLRFGWEWTQGAQNSGGAIFDESQERSSNPGETVRGRAGGERRERVVSEGEVLAVSCSGRLKMFGSGASAHGAGKPVRQKMPNYL
jgi:hypothetical protein